MASKIELRQRKPINWRSLHFGEPLFLRKSNFKSITVLPETYDVERLIASKKSSDGKIFLVKWANYELHDSTWEPESNIPTELVQSLYNNPTIETSRLKQAARTFESAIHHRLSSRANKITIEFDFDIFRYCFANDTTVMIQSVQDMSKLPMSSHWFYLLKQDGHGHSIRFPMRLEPKLRMKKVFVGDNGQVKLIHVPVERMTIFVASSVYNVENLP